MTATTAVRNRPALASRGMAALRDVAIDMVEAGLHAADPLAALQRRVQVDGDTLVVGAGGPGERRYDLSGRRVIVVGAGKATLCIAHGLEQLLGDRVGAGVVAVRSGEGYPLDRIEAIEADHPMPGPRSLEAAERVLALADRAGEDDLVVACFTGGSSALCSLPPPGVPFEAKRQLHRLLIASGASIGEINAVRKHVSAFKGGRLARHAAPAAVLNLTVSDVAGDALDLITDPTVQDTTTPADAVQVLTARGLWDRVDPSVRRHLERAEPAPDLSDLDVHTELLVTGDHVCAGMVDRAAELGLPAFVLSTSLEGESREAGAVLASVMRECARRGRPFEPPCVLVACGGETTVTLADCPGGEGGPNQELALATAVRLGAGDQVALAAVDTDGADGGSRYAGAVVDGTSGARAHELGLDLPGAILQHRAGEALARLEDLIVTGPTGTNVNDLLVVVIGPVHPKGAP